jgi:hypothetical protein
LFFVLSKTLGYLLLPTNFLIAIGFVGAILMLTRFASLGRKLVISAVVLLVICGLSPLGKALLYPLEQRFPPWDAARLTASSCSGRRSKPISPWRMERRWFGARRTGSSLPPHWRGDIPTRA